MDPPADTPQHMEISICLVVFFFESFPNVILNKEYGRFCCQKNKQNSRKVCHKVNSIMEKLTEM